MEATLPVVCMNDDSFKIAVIEDYNGLFFKTKREYIKAISTLHDDYDKYITMSKQALSSASQFSVKFYGQKILEVYKKAIDSKKESLISKLKKVVRK